MQSSISILLHHTKDTYEIILKVNKLLIYSLPLNLKQSSNAKFAKPKAIKEFKLRSYENICRARTSGVHHHDPNG